LKETSNQKSFIFRTNFIYFSNKSELFRRKDQTWRREKLQKERYEYSNQCQAGVLICQQPEQLQKSEASSRNLSSVSNHLVATKPIQKEKQFFSSNFHGKKSQKICFKTFASFSKMLGFLLLQ